MLSYYVPGKKSNQTAVHKPRFFMIFYLYVIDPILY